MFHRICPVRAHHEHLIGNDEVSHLHEVLNSHSKDFPIPQSSSLRNIRFEVFWLPNGDIRNSSPFPIPQKYPFWGFLASERGSPQLVIISKSFFGGKNAQDEDEEEDDDQISFQMIYWLSLFNASPTFSVKKNFSRSWSEESSRMIFFPFRPICCCSIRTLWFARAAASFVLATSIWNDSRVAQFYSNC